MSEFQYAGHKCEGNCGAVVFVASMRRCGACAAKLAPKPAAGPHRCNHPGCSVQVIGHDLCRAHFAAKRQAEAKAFETARKAFEQSPEGKRLAAERATRQMTEAKAKARAELWAQHKAGKLAMPEYDADTADGKPPRLVAGVEVRVNGAQVTLKGVGWSETFVDINAQKQLAAEKAARAKKAEEAARALRSAPKPKADEANKASKEERRQAKQGGKQKKAA